jgi:hypothetical protein
MEKTKKNNTIITNNPDVNDLGILKESKPLILDQIANYEYNMVESNIRNFKSHLNNQYALNRTLKNEESAKIIQEINNFVETRQSVVDKQLASLNELKTELFKICSENSMLEKQNDDLNTLQQSDECIQIADKLATISNIQKDINDFLEQNGV